MDSLKPAAIRAARTFAQTFVGVFVAGLIGNEVVMLNDIADLTLLNQATASGVVATLSFVQNALEAGRSNYSRG